MCSFFSNFTQTIMILPLNKPKVSHTELCGTFLTEKLLREFSPNQRYEIFVIVLFILILTLKKL